MPTAPTLYAANVSDPSGRPALAELTPSGQGSVPLASNIVLTFDKNVMAGMGEIIIRDDTGRTVFRGAIAGSSDMTISGASVTIDLPQELAYSTRYTVLVQSGFVTSLGGVACTANESGTFRTETRPGPVALLGTDGADDLRGSDADDTLSGAGGDDRLAGAGGNDRLDGGAGNDILHDHLGNNVLIGGDGNDEISATGDGTNVLEGGNGDDKLYGGTGTATLDGGAGNDLISIQRWTAGPGLVRAFGGEGNDVFYVSVQDHLAPIVVTGGGGVDTYYVINQSAMTITDFRTGAAGDIIGSLSTSSDNPFGSDGFFRLFQQGADTLLQYDQDGATGNAHTFRTWLTLAGITASDLTDANFEGDFHLDGDPTGLVRTGTAGNDTLEGTRLNDTLRGGAGDDKFVSYEGDDRLEGGDGNDMLRGGAGNDVLLGDGGRDNLDGQLGDDQLDGGDGHDRLVDWSGNNSFLGGEGDDFIESYGLGRNTLDGGVGNDYLLTFFGNDTLLGGPGHDTLEVNNAFYASLITQPKQELPNLIVLDGGEGDDTMRFKFLYDAPASVRATGGGGVDIYVADFRSLYASIVITDFKVGSGGDILDLMAYIPFYGPSLNPFDPAANMMRLVQQGADLTIQLNHGTGPMAGFVNLLTLQNVTAASLTSDNLLNGISPDGASGDLSLTGTDGADTLQGGMWNDSLRGGGGADSLAGGRGNDTLDGGAGNDVLVGGYGANRLIGGAGIDTALYASMSYGYAIKNDNGIWTVNNYNATNIYDQIHTLDTLVGVERLKIYERSWALDIDGTGGQVYRLYQAAFDRAPDKVGLGFWREMVDRGALTTADVSGEFVKSAEFVSLYGASPSNTDLITRFYQNMLNREPDPVGKAFWIKVLDTNQATVATVLSHFSESPENQQNLAAVIGNGFEYQPYV